MAATCVAKPPPFAAHFLPPPSHFVSDLENSLPNRVGDFHLLPTYWLSGTQRVTILTTTLFFLSPSTSLRPFVCVCLSACLPVYLSIRVFSLNHDEPHPQSSICHPGVLRGHSNPSAIIVVFVTVVTYSLCVDRWSVVLFGNTFFSIITFTLNSNRTNNEDATRQELSFSSAR